MAMDQQDITNLAAAMAEAMKRANVSSSFGPENVTGRQQMGAHQLGSSELQKEEKRQINTTRDAATALKNLRKELKSADKNFGHHSHILINSSKNVGARMLELNKQFATSGDALKFWSSRTGRELRTLNTQAHKLRKRLGEATLTTKERTKAEKELIAVEQRRASMLENEFAGASKTATVALILLANAARLVYEDLRTQLGSAGIGGFMENVGNAIMQGIDPSELSRISKENRMAQIALMGSTGDVNKMMHQTQSNMGELLLKTKNATEATELYATTASSLVKAGIKPSEEAIMDQIRATEKLTKISGMSALEFAKMNERLAESSGIRFSLMKLGQQERRQRLNTFSHMVEYNRAMGMSTEQAENAAKAMGELGAKSPLERMKEATKAAVAGGALGIAGGEEYRRIMIRGGPRNEAEAQVVSDFADAMSTQLQEARAAGDFGREMMISRLYDGLNLQQNFGKDSPHARALRDAAGVTDETFGDIKTTSEGLNDALKDLTGGFVDLGGVLKALDITTGAIKNFGVGDALGQVGFGFGGAYLATKMMPGLFGGNTKSGGFGKNLGKMAKFGGRALPGIGAIGALGKDVYDVASGENTYENYGAIAGSVIGGGIGLLGGPLGAAVGASAGNLIGEYIGGLFDPETTSKTAKQTERTAENSEKQTQLSKSSNDLLREGNELTRALVETIGGDQIMHRLNEIDKSSQRPPSYG